MPVNKKDAQCLYDALSGKIDVFNELEKINGEIEESINKITEYCANQHINHRIDIALALQKDAIFDKIRYVKLTEPKTIRIMLWRNAENLNFGKFIAYSNPSERGFVKRINSVTPKQSEVLKTDLKKLADLKKKRKSFSKWETAYGKALMQDVEKFKAQCDSGKITLENLKEISGFLLRKGKSASGDMKKKITDIFGETLEKALSDTQKQQFISEAITHYRKAASAESTRTPTGLASTPREAPPLTLHRQRERRRGVYGPTTREIQENTKLHKEALEQDFHNEAQKPRSVQLQEFLEKYPPKKIEEQYHVARKQLAGKSIASFFGHHGRDSQKLRLFRLKAALTDFSTYKETPSAKQAADHLGKVLFKILKEINQEDKELKFQLGDSALEKICRNMLIDLDKIYPQPELPKSSKPTQ